MGRRYLGGLPAVNVRAEAVDRGIRLKDKYGTAEGFGDVENRSTVMIRFDKDVEYTAKRQIQHIAVKACSQPEDA
ncbi:MAG: hypothetical protein LRY51_05540 [Geovibrio sp.]|nr:hypothetical protein [Geovibrio sp.]